MGNHKEKRRFKLLLNKVLLTGLISFIGLFFAACSTNEDPVIIKDEIEKVTIYFENSNSDQPSSYALDAVKESEIQTLDVLVFEDDGGSQKYLYRETVDPATIEVVDGTKRKFTVSLRDDSRPYNYVVLANVSDEVNTYFPNENANVGTEKEQLFKNFVSVQTGLWNTDTTSPGYKAIPMYGESGFKLISQLKNSTVFVIRGLVRVDIISSLSPLLFDLSKVYVYNRNTRGRIVGNETFLNKTDKRYTAPSVPDNKGMVHPTGNYGNSNAGYDVTSHKRELTHTIYLYESDVPENGNFLDATCLVVGGKYNGSGALNYYRIDFVDTPTEIKSDNSENPNWWETGPPESDSGSGGAVGTGNPFQALIRNHHYAIHITGVSGTGQTDKDAASNTLNSRLLYDYISWNDLENIVKIGSDTYKFSVNKTSVKVPGTVEVNITGSPTWDVVKTSDYDWFNVERVGNNTINVSLVDVTSSESLVGYFKIRLKNSSGQTVFQKVIRVEK